MKTAVGGTSKRSQEQAAAREKAAKEAAGQELPPRTPGGTPIGGRGGAPPPGIVARLRQPASNVYRNVQEPLDDLLGEMTSQVSGWGVYCLDF